MKQFTVFLLTAVFVSALSAMPASATMIGPPVNTAENAIDIAAAICDSQWGTEARRYGGVWSVSRSSWHAERVGDKWKVWVGEQKRPSLTVYVDVEFSPFPMRCDLGFQN